MQLAHKVAVVTGAGSGIGRALAQELAGRGCRLALLDVDDAGLAETARLVGGAPLVRHVDVSDEAAVTAAAAAVVGHFGQVDVVVNNAGIAHGGRTFWELPAADFARVMDVNFWGVVHGTRAFLPHLLTRPESAVVNTSSIFGVIGVTRQSAYCSSKFAVRGFTETLRMELRESAPHVRTLAVHPGGVKTAIAARALRAGVDEAEHREAAQAFERIARTTPAVAARTIVGALVAGRERVLVGPDAKALDLLARSLPQRYTRVLLAGLRRAAASGASPLSAPVVPAQVVPPVTSGLPEVPASA